MLPLSRRINLLIQLGEKIKIILSNFRKNIDRNGFGEMLMLARRHNPWFTQLSILNALNEWTIALEETNIQEWSSRYHFKNSGAKVIGVINAGNIPFVGMHDLLSILLSGHSYAGKNATDDSILLPFIVKILLSIEPDLTSTIQFTERLDKIDAVIATGSNNSSRYFNYYFGKYPNIIRKNRHGIALLTGNETRDELQLLGKDVFTYFGLGCRNISKLYVPEGYVFDYFFESIYDFNEVMQHHKYMNNFDYVNSILLLKRIPFLQNNFLIVREESSISSPISVLHYETYKTLTDLQGTLENHREDLQCVASDSKNLTSETLLKIRCGFGQTQSPALWDYADGVDTLSFLASL